MKIIENTSDSLSVKRANYQKYYLLYAILLIVLSIVDYVSLCTRNSTEASHSIGIITSAMLIVAAIYFFLLKRYVLLELSKATAAVNESRQYFRFSPLKVTTKSLEAVDHIEYYYKLRQNRLNQYAVAGIRCIDKAGHTVSSLNDRVASAGIKAALSLPTSRMLTQHGPDPKSIVEYEIAVDFAKIAGKPLTTNLT